MVKEPVEVETGVVEAEAEKVLKGDMNSAMHIAGEDMNDAKKPKDGKSGGGVVSSTSLGLLMRVRRWRLI